MTTFLDGAVADPERFSALFDAHYEEIRRYIGRRLDLDVAEDLAAETFLIAFRRRAGFDAAKGGTRPRRTGWNDWAGPTTRPRSSRPPRERRIGRTLPGPLATRCPVPPGPSCEDQPSVNVLALVRRRLGGWTS
ncbi:RNA polymerase sigma factor [Nonomuraea sp. NPDC003560]|uniref:RNA polymerase sigma factor n=1 Tax=Nonomuraea sp. NPDC003560 TaxID=3364341 RepID=UPI003698084F